MAYYTAGVTKITSKTVSSFSLTDQMMETRDDNLTLLQQFELNTVPIGQADIPREV